MPPILSVVVPVDNERNILGARVEAVKHVKVIILAEERSTDGTRKFIAQHLSDPGCRMVLKPRNHGKGTAVPVGFRNATGQIRLFDQLPLLLKFERLAGPPLGIFLVALASVGTNDTNA